MVYEFIIFVDFCNWFFIFVSVFFVVFFMFIFFVFFVKWFIVKEGIDYFEQEVFGVIFVLVERIIDVQEIQRVYVGIEVIIKVIRVFINF